MFLDYKNNKIEQDIMINWQPYKKPKNQLHLKHSSILSKEKIK